jgi:hypothetical protein
MAHKPHRLSERDYDDAVRSIVFRYAVKPGAILLCIFVVCAILQSLLHITWEPFPYMFTGIGGIPALIVYFKREFSSE